MAASILSAEELSLLESSLPFASELERQRIEEILRSLSQTTEKQPDANPPSESVVAKTRLEAAQLLGVDERTISKWAGDPSFPGKSGDAGRQNGYFPIEAIKRWRVEVLGSRSLAGSGLTTDDTGSQLRLRKLAAETAKRELEFEQACGRLIERDTHLGTVVAALSAARSIAEEFPDRVVAYLPADRKKTRRIWRREATKLVRSLLEAMADAVVNEDDDEDGDDDGKLGRSVDRRDTAPREPSGEASTPVGDAGLAATESPSSA